LKSKVAITGIGMVTPLGITTHDCWENMVAGKSGIDLIRQFDTSGCITKIGGQIPDSYFSLEKAYFSENQLIRTSLPNRLSLYCVKQAIDDSQIVLNRMDSQNISVISGSGGSSYGDEISEMEKELGMQLAPGWEMLDAHAAIVGREFGFQGPCFNVATACSSGAFAVGLGYDHVINNHGVCIVIGVDTMLLKDTVVGFNQLMALSEHNQFPNKASRPFDKKRSGFVISDGACAIILEPYDWAVARNARIYAVISGYAMTSEAYNIMAPEPGGAGMAETMRLALIRSGIGIDNIGYINAHGTSTIHNDLAETQAIKLVFGERASQIPVSSQKSMIGHTIGAAGTIETAVTALTLYNQIITPTINYEEPDPLCNLDYVPNQSRLVSGLSSALTNSFGFGGHNCTVALEINLPYDTYAG